MFLLPHVLVGQAIGQRVKRVGPTALLAWASHYLLDRIPHVDIMPLLGHPLGTPVDRTGVLVAALDTAVATTIGLTLARDRAERGAMLTGGLMAALPDVVDNVPLWGPRLRKLRPFFVQGCLHHWCSRPVGPSRRLPGLLPQVAVALGALALVWLARRR